MEEEVKADSPQQEEYQPEGTGLAQEMMDEEEEVQQPVQLDESPSAKQNAMPMEDMQSVVGSIK